MIAIVTMPQKITTQVDLSEAVFNLTDGNPPKSWAKLGEIAMAQAKVQFANNEQIIKAASETYKIEAIL